MGGKDQRLTLMMHVIRERSEEDRDRPWSGAMTYVPRTWGVVGATA